MDGMGSPEQARTVWKYAIDLGPPTRLLVPPTSRIVHFGLDVARAVGGAGRSLACWIEVARYQPATMPLDLVVIPTGVDLPVGVSWAHRGTYCDDYSATVWHLYEAERP